MSLRILVVDDVEGWRQQLQDVLETMGYEVDTSEGFVEAKRLLECIRYDLILLDICLDQSDPSYVSFQKFCMLLRENYPELSILAMSGEKIDPEFMFSLREQGVSDFVSKKDPFSLRDFQKRIERLIRRRCSFPGMDVVSILFLAADPTDASRLRLGEELRDIQERLQLAKLRERFVLHQRMSVRPADISQALLDVQPRIVHFSGHGAATGALCFENQDGESHPIQPAAIAALFELFADQVSCVVLNACYSEIQANAIAKHIDYVIGMNRTIGDRAAIAFSVGFYQALGTGCTIDEAYKLGCVHIRLHNIPEDLTPTLIKKTQA